MKLDSIQKEKEHLLKNQENYINNLITLIESLDIKINELTERLEFAENEKRKLESKIRFNEIDIKKRDEEILQLLEKNKELSKALKNKETVINSIKDTKNEDVLKPKEITLDECVKNNSTKVNKLKAKFLKDSNEEFKQFILLNKVYNGNSKIIEEILNGHIYNGTIERKDARTLLLISFFYGFHNELIDTFGYFKNIYRESSSFGELIRALDIEKGINIDTSIKEPVSVLIDRVKYNIKGVDEEILIKVIKLINLYSYKVFKNYVVSSENINICIYDGLEISKIRGYQELRNSSGEIKYKLTNEQCCKGCNTVYITNKRYKKISKSLGMYYLDESKFNVINYDKNSLQEKESNELTKTSQYSLYTELLNQYKLNNIDRARKLFDEIVEDNLLLSRYSKTQCVTLLFIGYLINNSTRGSRKIMLACNIGTSVDTILYKRLVEKKDFIDYVHLYKNSMILIDGKVKDRIIDDALRIGKDYGLYQSVINSREENYDNNLSAESIIKKLGYSTTLSREVRWNILKNSVVPKVGIGKVMSHLRFLIRMNRNRDVMANAVREWQYDLERLDKLN